MSIATHNSEKLLLADLREAHISHPNSRCLHLRFSRSTEEKSTWMLALKRAIHYALDGAVNQIYITYDNDVFIHGSGLTLKRLNDLLISLARSLNSSSLQEIANIYEVGIHWDALERLCLRKLQEADEFYLQQKIANRLTSDQDESFNLTYDHMFSEVDKALIKTLSERRMKRKSPLVLVAEDDPFSQVLIKKALETTFTLCLSKDGQGAILNYIKHAPDILFLDIEMPDINGHDVLKRILSFDKDAYIVMFSGNGDRENVIKALNNGAQGFVGKPFTREKLIQYIQKSPFKTIRNPLQQDSVSA